MTLDGVESQDKWYNFFLMVLFVLYLKVLTLVQSRNCVRHMSWSACYASCSDICIQNVGVFCYFPWWH